MNKVILLLAITVITLASCTKKIYVPVQSVKVEYRDKIQRDSVYILDSVLIKSINDTVYLTKYRTELKYKIQRDSIHVKDTIREPYEVEKITKVEKQLSLYQKFCINGFTFLLSFIAGFLLVRYRKKIGNIAIWIFKKVL